MNIFVLTGGRSKMNTFAELSVQIWQARQKPKPNGYKAGASYLMSNPAEIIENAQNDDNV